MARILHVFGGPGGVPAGTRRVKHRHSAQLCQLHQQHRSDDIHAQRALDNIHVRPAIRQYSNKLDGVSRRWRRPRATAFNAQHDVSSNHSDLSGGAADFVEVDFQMASQNMLHDFIFTGRETMPFTCILTGHRATLLAADGLLFGAALCRTAQTCWMPALRRTSRRATRAGTAPANLSPNRSIRPCTPRGQIVRSSEASMRPTWECCTSVGIPVHAMCSFGSNVRGRMQRGLR